MTQEPLDRVAKCPRLFPTAPFPQADLFDFFFLFKAPLAQRKLAKNYWELTMLKVTYYSILVSICCVVTSLSERHLILPILQVGKLSLKGVKKPASKVQLTDLNSSNLAVIYFTI